MKRRKFIALVGGVAAMLVLTSGASAQETGRTYRLGILTVTTRSLEAFRDITLAELAKYGFVEGRNLIVDARIGSGDALPILARELVAGKPDAIHAVTTASVQAVRQATTTLPIVMIGDDPVGHGFAASLARPGGNVTGFTIQAAELDAKRLQVLHEAVPSARRIAILALPQDTENIREMQRTALAFGIETHVFRAGQLSDYAAAFASMRKAGAQALVITAHSQFFHGGVPLADLAVEARLPTICEWAEMARTGCAIGYGPNLRDMRRRVADYLARILQGTPPSALPIEGPTRFEFAINLKTTKTLGLTIPQAILLRADEVIE
jgi:putative ABC transport system substrate-binding protein